MKYILTISLLLFSNVLPAIDLLSNIKIASCSQPTGKSYYPELGITTTKTSGWKDDGIKSGIVKLSKIGKNKYDIVFVDTYRRIVSSVEEGSHVLMLSYKENIISFLVISLGKTVEIYTFLKNNSGKLEYIYISSRSILMPKASVMRGDCDFINFSKI
jgi:hypothetical protein